jgi:large subunit ribosomal protein L24
MAKIRKGDTVQVISGKDKGLTGTVLVVYPTTDRVLVEGVNRVKRHTKVGQSQRGARTGGIVTQEAAIHISNVMLVDSSTKKPTRVGSRKQTVEKTRADGSTYETTRNVRISRRSGEDI